MYFAISSTLAADRAVDLIALSLGRRSSENISNNTTALDQGGRELQICFFSFNRECYYLIIGDAL